MRIFLLFIVFFCTANNAFSKYIGPVEVFSVSVGSMAHEINIPPESDDPTWFSEFYVLNDNTVAIMDNRTVKIYVNSVLDRSFNVDEYNSSQFRGRFFKDGVYSYRLEDPQNDKYNLYKYDYTGDIIAEYGSAIGDIQDLYYVSNSGYFIAQANKRNFYLYNSGGVLVEDYGNIKPPQITDRTYRNSNGDTYAVFNSETYVFSNEVEINKIIPPTPDSNFFYLLSDKAISKADACGHVLGSVTIPENVEFEGQSSAPGVEPQIFIHDRYGWPVNDDSGNVYTWKTTPNALSVLKWEWVDDPSDPQSGPEPPPSIAVQASLDGLLFTWGASPQDPGCVDSYEVERATSSDGIYSSIGSTNAGTLRYNDTTILPGETVYYKVRAKSGGEYSDYTAVDSGKRF